MPIKKILLITSLFIISLFIMFLKKKLVIYNYNYKLLSHVKRISLIFYAILGLETDILAFTASISIKNGSLGSGLYLVMS